MTATQLIDDLFESGIELSVAGESIRLVYPTGSLTDTDVDNLRRLKTDVLQRLRLAEGLPVDANAAMLLGLDQVDPDTLPKHH